MRVRFLSFYSFNIDYRRAVFLDVKFYLVINFIVMVLIYDLDFSIKFK